MKYIKTYDVFKPDRVLYHGSSAKIDVLKPFPSDIMDGESVVFAASEKWLALLFIAKYSDDDIGIGLVNDIPYIKENKEGAFALLDISGYLYTVKDDGFHSDDRLGIEQLEFINKNSVKIESVEVIDNVMESLRALKSSVTIVPYDIAISIQDNEI